MSAYFRCPQGHRWRVAVADTSADETHCPLCGAAAERTEPAADPSEEVAPAPTLPRIPGYEVLGVIGRGPVGTAERLVMWARRRPVAAALAVVSAAAAVALLVGGLLHNAQLRSDLDRANHHYQAARKAIDGLLLEVAEEQPAYDHRMLERRHEMLRRALAVCAAVIEQAGDEPMARRHLALAHERSGDLHRQLGEYEDAVAAYGRAIQALEGLLEDNPDDPRLLRRLAAAHNYQGWARTMTTEPAKALLAYRSAREILRGLLARVPDEPALRRELGRVHYNLGIFYFETGKPDLATVELEEAVALSLGPGGRPPDDPDFRYHLARAYLILGNVCYGSGRLEQCEQYASKGVALLDSLRRAAPFRPDYCEDLAVGLGNRANALAELQRGAEAEMDLRRALALLEGLVLQFPHHPGYRAQLANSLNSLGSALFPGNAAGARAALEKARELLRRLHEESRDTLPSPYQGDLGMTTGNLGLLVVEQEEWARAAALLPLGLALRPVWPAQPQAALTRARGLLEEGLRHLDAALEANPEHPAYTAVRKLHQEKLDRLRKR